MAKHLLPDPDAPFFLFLQVKVFYRATPFLSLELPYHAKFALDLYLTVQY